MNKTYYVGITVRHIAIVESYPDLLVAAVGDLCRRFLCFFLTRRWAEILSRSIVVIVVEGPSSVVIQHKHIGVIYGVRLLSVPPLSGMRVPYPLFRTKMWKKIAVTASNRGDLQRLNYNKTMFFDALSDARVGWGGNTSSPFSVVGSR